MLQTKPACICGCPVHTEWWKEDVTSLSGQTAVSSEPGGLSEMGYSQ